MCKIALVLFAAAAILEPGPAGGWQQWRGQRGDGAIENGELPSAWPERLKLIWRVELGGGDGSPIVADGAVFVHSRQGEDEVVSRVDLETGAVVWQDRYGPIPYQWPWPGAESRGKGPFSTPTVADGRLFTVGVSQTVSAYDAKSGRLLWRKAFDKGLSFGTSTSPIVVDGMCLVHVGEKKAGALTAFDAETGDVAWRNDYDAPSYATPYMTDLHGRRQLIVLSAQKLSGVDPASGAVIWSADAPHKWDENIASPVRVGSTFVVSAVAEGTRGILVNREGDRWEATEVWHDGRLSAYTNSPVAIGHRVYGFANQRKGQYFVLEPDSGKVVWRGPGRQGEHASMVFKGRTILSLKGDGVLEVLAVEGDSVRATASIPVAKTTTWSHPVFVGTRLLIKDVRGLSMFSTTEGESGRAIAEGEPKAMEPISRLTRVGSDGAEMVLIPGGPFTMGSETGDPDESPVRVVDVDSFYIDRTEVTNSQYRRFIEETGHREPSRWDRKDFNRPKQPVTGVSWFDAMAYAAWAGKRLPTEAEWEKAARGGITGARYPWGNDPAVVDSTYRANFEFAGEKVLPGYRTTYPVGTFEPNRFGLYDAAGNAWEWVLDPYVETAYSSGGTDNPVAGPMRVGEILAAPHDSTTARVIRGGSCDDYGHLIRVANRSHHPVSWRGNAIGFRCVLPVDDVD